MHLYVFCASTLVRQIGSSDAVSARLTGPCQGVQGFDANHFERADLANLPVKTFHDNASLWILALV